AARAGAEAEPGLSGSEKLPPAPEKGALWISVGKDDLARPAAAELPLGTAVAQSATAAIYKISPSAVLQVSRLMHEKFHKCGGFFAHATEAQAEADLKPAPAANGGPYTLDQQAVVRPLAARVTEGDLRSTIETLSSYDDRYYTSDTGVAAAKALAELWGKASKGLPGASVKLVTHQDWPQPSVVLTVPGASRPDEIVVLGGHLDSINVEWGGSGHAPGADDNASGIAVLTETIKLLAQAGFRPKRTLQFMAYSAEEVGLRGSADIASQYRDQGAKVVGVIQYDMTDFAGSGDKIYLVTDNVDPALTKFLGRLIDAYAGVGWSTTECGYACSDHASWTRSGYPSSIAFESTFDGMNQNIHTDRDTLANAGGDAVHSVPFAKLALGFAVELAKPAGAAGVSAR
ncbi:MAG: M20/M25/M40 family metallo-hydrolase, partial [Elusimicrobia bacterium]|nr:M20/M25/M40 family metallo-hydrolase [Elusimicrobiota bacterium]